LLLRSFYCCQKPATRQTTHLREEVPAGWQGYKVK